MILLNFQQILFYYKNFQVNYLILLENFKNYQVNQAKAAIVHGGITGMGPGKSALKQMLPQSASDFIFAIIIAIFAMTNANPVTIKLFFYEFEASQALIIFFSAALGAIIMALLGTVRYVRRLSEIKRLRKEIESLKIAIEPQHAWTSAFVAIDALATRNCDC